MSTATKEAFEDLERQLTRELAQLLKQQIEGYNASDTVVMAALIALMLERAKKV